MIRIHAKFSRGRGSIQKMSGLNEHNGWKYGGTAYIGGARRSHYRAFSQHRRRFTTTQAGTRLSRVPVEPAPNFSHSAGRMNRGLELFGSATFYSGFKKAFASK